MNKPGNTLGLFLTSNHLIFSSGFLFICNMEMGMNNTEFDIYCRAYLHDLLLLKDTGVSLGNLLRITRELYNIPERKFAARVGLKVRELRDIEEGCAPFPTMFASCIFAYGLPAWWAAGDNNGAVTSPSGMPGASAVARYITKSSPR